MPPSSFKEWLRYWVIFFSWDEGNLSSWLPTYIGTLWAIWKLRNAQVFRHQRPTIPSITFHLQDSVKLHDTFTKACHDPTRNPRDPTIPPGFDVVHLGQQTHGSPSLTIQIAGRKYKLRSLDGVAWVGDMGDHNGHLQHVQFAIRRRISLPKLLHASTQSHGLPLTITCSPGSWPSRAPSSITCVRLNL